MAYKALKTPHKRLLFYRSVYSYLLFRLIVGHSMAIRAATKTGTINTLIRERVFGIFNDLDVGNIFLSCICKCFFSILFGVFSNKESFIDGLFAESIPSWNLQRRTRKRNFAVRFNTGLFILSQHNDAIDFLNPSPSNAIIFYDVNYRPLKLTFLKWRLLISLAAFKAYRFRVPAVPAVPIFLFIVETLLFVFVRSLF